MSMLARYKKHGGFEQLLVLIETSNSKKQEQFLKLIEQENPTTAALLKTKILTLPKIFSWEPSLLGDITNHIPPKILAVILQNQPEDLITKATATFTHGKRTEIMAMLKDVKATPGELDSANARLVTTVRTMIKNKEINISKVAPELDIADLKVA